MNPHQITADFEAALCKYTGAKHAVVVTSCTMALLLACAWWRHKHGRTTIGIPKRTYVSVPMSILHSGNDLSFHDEKWHGAYRLRGTNIWDSARRFHDDMSLVPSEMQCVSFHASKILSLEQGGAILHHDAEADTWFRKARFDGRTQGVDPKDDTFDTLGYHCYVSPSVSAMGLMKLSVLPKWNDDLPNSNYPDLSQAPIFARYANRAIAAE